MVVDCCIAQNCEEIACYWVQMCVALDRCIVQIDVVVGYIVLNCVTADYCIVQYYVVVDCNCGLLYSTEM